MKEQQVLPLILHRGDNLWYKFVNTGAHMRPFTRENEIRRISVDFSRSPCRAKQWTRILPGIKTLKNVLSCGTVKWTVYSFRVYPRSVVVFADLSNVFNIERRSNLLNVKSRSVCNIFKTMRASFCVKFRSSTLIRETNYS